MEAPNIVKCLVTDHYANDTVTSNCIDNENINFFYKQALQAKIGASLRERIDFDSIKVVANGKNKEVFEASDTQLNRKVALCFPKYQCHNELEVFSQVSHPNVVGLLEYQSKEETGFDMMTMEL